MVEPGYSYLLSLLFHGPDVDEDLPSRAYDPNEFLEGSNASLLCGEVVDDRNADGSIKLV